MLKIKSYVKVNSLAEAYELNQKKTACILGGMVWMKMGNRAISTAIDLSGLGLDAISENDDEFVIGCMTPLHDLETNEALNTYTHGAMKESLCHIVGVQFRNCATVGGSIYGRYGFSDVLTMFLGMDTWVELYDAGRIPLTEFVNMKKDNDILVNIIVQRPQFAVSQPLFTLKQPCSLKKSISSVSGEISAWRFTPLSQKLIFIFHPSYCFPGSSCQYFYKKGSVFL